MFSELTVEFFSWVRGALIALFVLNALLYLNNRQKLFLFYSIYTFLFALILFLLNSILVTERLILQVALPLFFLIAYCYFYVAREVLQLKKILPDWDKKIQKNARYLFIASIPVYLTQFIFNKNIFYGFNIILILAIIYFIIKVHQKVKKSKFILSSLFNSGAITLIIFGALSFYAATSPFKDYMLQQGIHPMLFIYLGLMYEIMVFATILGYRITNLENEEIDTNLQLVVQIAETESLRMEMLKSQMNPHFIFNMLNSINSLIIKNEIENASNYITKFSRFIREILNNSKKTHMSIADELAIIKLYVILEQARIEGGFEYEVIIEDNISANFIQIPPMFLQPFIENAIWHGLAHSDKPKKLTIQLKKDEKYYYLEVIDNGIGYQKGLEIAKQKLVKSTGLAVTIVKNRLQSLYKNNETDVTIQDLTTTTGSGTKVTFKFPLAD